MHGFSYVVNLLSSSHGTSLHLPRKVLNETRVPVKQLKDIEKQAKMS